MLHDGIEAHRKKNFRKRATFCFSLLHEDRCRVARDFMNAHAKRKLMAAWYLSTEPIAEFKSDFINGEMYRFRIKWKNLVGPQRQQGP
jgi:hypothetical protein